MKIRWADVFFCVVTFVFIGFSFSLLLELPSELKNGLYPAIWTTQQSLDILDEKMEKLVTEMIYQECRP